MIPPFRRADVIVATTVAALTLVIALFFAPRGYQAGFVDMGHDGYQLRQVLDLSEGGVIFRDTFDQYGPARARQLHRREPVARREAPLAAGNLRTAHRRLHAESVS
jgi:hypothetical protein